MSRLSQLSLRWMLLFSLSLPLISLQVMGCSDDPNNDGTCETEDNCPEGEFCVDGECVPSGECENFFSCEVDQDCIDQGLDICTGGCCF